MKFYKQIKSKALAIIVLVAVIFSAVFIRFVPNYSKKYGFEVVSLWDYNKYHQGYCLAEGRILGDQELLQNLAINYFKRYHDYEILRNNLINEHDFGSKFYTGSVSKLYLIGDFNEENWFDFLVENTDRKSFEYEIKDKKQVNIPDLPEYFIYKDEILGFRQPIILAEDKKPFLNGKMFLEKSFLIKENKFFVNYVEVSDIGFYIELNGIKNLMKIKSGYESLENFNEVLAYTHLKHLRRKFLYDNCGNINFNIKAPAEQELDMWIHGG